MSFIGWFYGDILHGHYLFNAADSLPPICLRSECSGPPRWRGHVAAILPALIKRMGVTDVVINRGIWSNGRIQNDTAVALARLAQQLSGTVNFYWKTTTALNGRLCPVDPAVDVFRMAGWRVYDARALYKRACKMP